MSAPQSVEGGWHPISQTPDEPCNVLLYFDKLREWHLPDGTVAVTEPMRDELERFYTGWWDGAQWLESGTGHEVFEFWKDEQSLPTHWMRLPEGPSGRSA